MGDIYAENHWKDVPDPRDLDAAHAREITMQCDVCSEFVRPDEISRCWAAGGIETFACDRCTERSR